MPGDKPPLMEPLDLERGKEALDHGIVPTISSAAHAADHPLLPEHRLIGGAGVLDSAIGMMQQAGLRPAPRDRSLQSPHQETGSELRPDRPAHDASRESVIEDRQIAPARARGDVAHVAHSDAIGRLGRERPREAIRRERTVVATLGRHAPAPGLLDSGALGGAAQVIPQTSWRDDSYRWVRQLQQVLVAAHE